MSISSSSSARYVLKSSLQFHWARKKLLKQGPPSILCEVRGPWGSHPPWKHIQHKQGVNYDIWSVSHKPFLWAIPSFHRISQRCPVAGRGQYRSWRFWFSWCLLSSSAWSGLRVCGPANAMAGIFFPEGRSDTIWDWTWLVVGCFFPCQAQGPRSSK